MPSKPIVIVVGLLLAAVLGFGTAVAQGEELAILSESVESQFPDGVVFKLTASGPDSIEDVRVFLKTLGGETSSYGRLDVTSGTLVSGEYFLGTSTGVQHIPPGTLIRYHFELRDSAGRVLRTPAKEFLYEDSRFEWLHVSEDNITVYYYGGAISEFIKKRAEIVLDAAMEALDVMEPVLGIQVEEPIRLVLYSNYRDMNAALPFRSQAVRQDLVTQGQAWPNERVLLVLGTDSSVAGITSHEIVHILVSEASGLGYGLVPTWLNEGLAEYGNIDKTDSYTQALIMGIYTRQVKPLSYLSAFGGEPEDIVIAYGQSRSVVSYLIAIYGEEKMAELMVALQSMRSVDEALLSVYGFDQHGLDSQWRTAIGLEPFPAPDELEEALRQTPTPEATPASQVAAPAPEATPEERKPRSGYGCNVSSSQAQGHAPLGLPLFALFGLPILFRPLLRRIGLRGK